MKRKKKDSINDFDNKEDELINNYNINSDCPNSSSVRNSSQKNAVNDAIQNSNIIKNENHNGMKGESFYSKNENKIIQKEEVDKEVTEKNEEKSEKNEETDIESLFYNYEHIKCFNEDDSVNKLGLSASNSIEKNSTLYNLTKIENEYSQESNNYTENNID
jgi:hypothetical protein